MVDPPRVHPPADLEVNLVIRAGTGVWQGAQVRRGARIGTHCVIGRDAFIDEGVSLVAMSSAEAEFSKLADTNYRDVNIALANEFGPRRTALDAAAAPDRTPYSGAPEHGVR